MVPVVKNLPASARDTRDMYSTPRSERFHVGGNGNPLPYSCLRNAMDRWAWYATVHGVAESKTQLSIHIHTETQLLTFLFIGYFYMTLYSIFFIITFESLEKFVKSEVSSILKGPYTFYKGFYKLINNYCFSLFSVCLGKNITDLMERCTNTVISVK